jgi:peptidyl-prolyl cis-trans isomerase C
VKLGAWTGPIASGYGWHVVFAESITPQRIPDFDDIEADVKSAWIEERRNAVRVQLYKAMRARYDVVLPVRTQPAAPPASGVSK